LLINLTT